jgi:hypothetical protein
MHNISKWGSMPFIERANLYIYSKEWVHRDLYCFCPSSFFGATWMCRSCCCWAWGGVVWRCTTTVTVRLLELIKSNNSGGMDILPLHLVSLFHTRRTVIHDFQPLLCIIHNEKKSFIWIFTIFQVCLVFLFIFPALFELKFANLNLLRLVYVWFNIWLD